MPQPTLMNLKVLLPFQVFADKTGVSRIVAENLRGLVRTSATPAGLRCGARARNSDLPTRRRSRGLCGRR